ncbi:MAG: noncanonical pyrimidine nucleotidase, YjjG family [Spirochaetaceae bacterium 4572_59]|nr:MAG: noncanonical pyrimidine nucleotidase, YjjG family [Spirochaetaceae bacterium 4572_59]
MNLTYHTLLFDADGTLLNFKRSEKNALEHTRVYMQSRLESEEFRQIYHKINSSLWIELEEGTISPAGLKTERFRRFALELGVSRDPQELSDYYLYKLGKESHFLAGAPSLIKALAPHYTMGLISNGLTIVQEARFDRPEIQDYFKSIVISEKVGSAKPSAEIFKHSAEDLQIELNKKVLIIGDSLTSDIAGGINAGISTCWYNPGGWINESPWKADLEVRSFGELQEILLGKE